MNQHSKRGGQANGNSMDELRRGATRPAVVVAIVLCVGFAVAMVAIWPFRKPPSHQEMQTQPKAAVQTEIPKPEAVQTEIPTPEAVSRVSVPDSAVPLELPTATPVSQANPATHQLMDDHINSPTPGEDDQSYTFSHDVKDETITFEAVNPKTQVAGLMTVTISGTFRGKRLWDGQSAVGSHLQGDAQATFSFVPYYPYSPSYSAVRRLRLDGDTTDDSVYTDVKIRATGTDGSIQSFVLREVVIASEDGAKITFQQVTLPAALNTQE
jgi:hypothetical protein